MITAQLEKDFKYTLSKFSKEEILKWKDSTVLITGCAGFLGFYMVNFLYHFADELQIKKVICLDNFMLGYPKWMDVIKSDIRFHVQKFDIISDKIEDVVEIQTHGSPSILNSIVCPSCKNPSGTFISIIS